MAAPCDLGERDITKLAVHKRATAGIGYVPQEREIFPSLSVMENLTIGETPRAQWTERSDLRALSQPGRAPRPTWATSSPAANSKCSPSPGR